MNFKRYKNMSDQAIEAFRLDAFKELDVEETADNLEMFQRAWSYGHDGGFEEVFHHFRDLVGIFRDADNDF